MTDKTPEPQAGRGGECGHARHHDGRPQAGRRRRTRGPRRSRRPAPACRSADKDLITITWTEQMEFNGRTTDTAGRPPARADFFGIVDAQMTDARLHCDRR